MKGLILIFVLLSGISSAIAQEKLWLDKNYQWTDDSIQAVRYALVSKINKKCIKVEEYALEGQKKDVWHFSEYKSNPRKRIREGLHTSFYANGKDSLTEVYRDNRLEGQTMVYYPDGAIHLARSYSDGKLDGTLLQYYPDGKLRRKEHYSENQCTDGKMFDKHGTEMAHQPYFVFPSFPGGIENLMKLVANVTKYPEDAWKQVCSCFQDKQEVHQGGRVCFGRTKEGCLAFLRIQKQSPQKDKGRPAYIILCKWQGQPDRSI